MMIIITQLSVDWLLFSRKKAVTEGNTKLKTCSSDTTRRYISSYGIYQIKLEKLSTISLFKKVNDTPNRVTVWLNLDNL